MQNSFALSAAYAAAVLSCPFYGVTPIRPQGPRLPEPFRLSQKSRSRGLLFRPLAGGRSTAPTGRANPGGPQATSVAGLTLCPTRCPGQQHTVMDQAQYLDHAVRRHAVDHEVSRLADAMLRGDQSARQIKMKGSDTCETGNLARSGPARRLSHRGQCSEDEPVVAPGSFKAPLPGGLEEDGVDAVLGTPDQPIRHYARSAARRSRRRAMVRSCSASASSDVAMVTERPASASAIPALASVVIASSSSRSSA